MQNDFIYDIETYRNLFSCCTVHAPTGTRFIHEVSERRDQSREFSQFIHWIASFEGARMVGYNNEGFDYPVIHHLVRMGQFTAWDGYQKAQDIIGADHEQRFKNMVWPDQRIVPQLDLYKVHHFDNMARATSLKALEIAMKSWSVVDLPYDPHKNLNSSQMDDIINYMCHDVRETLKFYERSKEKIEFRDRVSGMYGFDATNFNDTKIGKEFFTSKLEDAQNGITGTRLRPKKARQTPRKTIALADVILPSIQFQHPEFARVLDLFKGLTLKGTETKGFFGQFETFVYPNGSGETIHKDNISAEQVREKEANGARRLKSSDGKGKFGCYIGGIDFIFGTGGIHGSLHNRTFISTDDEDCIDIDVASYYPSLSIANRFFPAHLSELFCDLNEELFNERIAVGKKTDAGGTIKLGLNGTYGDSNNEYSCFFDPQYTMAITVNGQLLLCMLAERLMKLEGVRLIQINTDGMTAMVPKNQREAFMRVCKEWEALTKLELEDVTYSRMFIRDVNNYVAESWGVDKETGLPQRNVKLKGAYEHDVQWHQNHSSLIVAKAVEAYLIHGTRVEETVYYHTDCFDFCRTAKVPRSSRLQTETGQPLQRVMRYYIALNGPELVKVMPPTKPKQMEKEEFDRLEAYRKEVVARLIDIRRTPQYSQFPDLVNEEFKLVDQLEHLELPERHFGIDVGYMIGDACDIRNFDWSNLNRNWYVERVYELIKGVGQ